MAISSVPFALQNVPINADVVREAVSSLVPNAGGIVQSGDFPVTQTGTPSMAVAVGVGRAWIPGTNVANLAGQTYSKQAQYFVLNDASVTLTIATADATNPRIDVVYIAIRDQNYTGTNNDAQLAVATGTPNATPAAPSIPSNAIALANVAVAAGVSSIVNANITTAAVPLAVTPPNTLQTLTTADATWAYNCQLFTEYDLQGHKMVTFQFIVARTGGGAFTVNTGAWTSLFSNMIPSGYRPTDSITVAGTYEFNGLGAALLKVDTAGTISAAGVTGSFSCGTPTKLSASFVWRTA
jgi:hypothetical protein